MSDDRFRSAIRSGLAPLIDRVDAGPDWEEVVEDLEKTVWRQLPGWAVAAAAAFAVLIGVGGLALTLGGGSGSTADTGQPTGTTRPTLGFDRAWGLAYPPGWYRSDSEMMPNLGWPSVTIATMPLRAGGDTCAQLPPLTAPIQCASSNPHG